MHRLMSPLDTTVIKLYYMGIKSREDQDKQIWET